jgi:hypothetical protein
MTEIRLMFGRAFGSEREARTINTSRIVESCTEKISVIYRRLRKNGAFNVQPKDREETTNNTKASKLKSILALISANPADEHKDNNHR